jgi:hypothetical protein
MRLCLKTFSSKPLEAMESGFRHSSNVPPCRHTDVNTLDSGDLPALGITINLRVDIQVHMESKQKGSIIVHTLMESANLIPRE